MADPTWRYRVGVEERGPVTAQEICDLLAQGAITLQTPLFCAAVNRWIAAEAIPGFRQAALRAETVVVPALPPIEAPPAPAEPAATPAAAPPAPATQSQMQSVQIASATVTKNPAPVAAPAAAAVEKVAVAPEPAPVVARSLVAQCVPAVAQPAPVITEPAPAVAQFAPQVVQPEIVAPAAPAQLSYATPTHDLYALQPHPWLRFWARLADCWICIAPSAVIAAVLVMPFWNHGAPSPFLVVTMFWAVFIGIESLMLAMFGTTPGKAMLKIRVESNQGEKPTLLQAIRRSIQVWFLGEAMGLPLLPIVTRLIAYAMLTSSGSTIWDRNTGLRVTHGRCHPLRIGSVAIFAWGLPALVGAALVTSSTAMQFKKSLKPIALAPLVKPNISITPARAFAAVPRPAPSVPAFAPVKTAIVDERLRQLSGTWSIIVNQTTNQGTLHWKNTLMLQEDGTFRQKVRAARHSVEQSEYSQDWAGNWTIKDNQVIQTVTVSTSPQHPAGKYVFTLITNDASSMTMQLQSQPATAAGASAHPTYKFHKAMSVADTAD
jgi:uncharacterized RDD family membrane protein YckC